jgi:hypothetical protein
MGKSISQIKDTRRKDGKSKWPMNLGLIKTGPCYLVFINELFVYCSVMNGAKHIASSFLVFSFPALFMTVSVWVAFDVIATCHIMKFGDNDKRISEK